MKISVIVTIYNLENYIDKCIESVINQSYKNIELILVDDGSNDSSRNICLKYNNMTNVRYYFKENGGVSSARNFGIDKATGDYILFIDGDDFLYSDDVLENLVKLLNKHKPDVMVYRMASYYDKKNKITRDIEFLIDEDEIKDYRYLAKLVEQSKLSISPCDKIIRTELLKKNNVYFDETIKMYEDLDWSFKLYLDKSIKYYICNNVAYVYRKQRDGSTTMTFTKSKIDTMMKVFKKWYEYQYEDATLKEILLNYLSYQYGIIITSFNRKNVNKKDRKEFYKFQNIFEYDLNYKVKKINKFRRLVGLNITIFILKFYLVIKKKGLYRIGENNEK